LRDLIVAFEAHRAKQYHLGLGRKPIAKTTFASANQNRDYRIFEDFAFYMMEQARKKRVTDIFKLKGNVYAFDSTTIDLCLSLFPWAHFRKTKAAIKMHTLLDLKGSIPTFISLTTGKVHDVNVLDALPLGKDAVVAMDRGYVDFARLYAMNLFPAFFVIRAKSNLRYRRIHSQEVDKTLGLRSDQHIVLTTKKSMDAYPEALRRVTYVDLDTNKRFVYLTNIFTVPATTVADIYKQRWQVELFFKQIKQNLKIKSFVGTSENAVKTQIYCALIAILLMNRLKAVSDSRRQACKQKSFSFSNMTAMLRMSLFRCCDLNSWLSNPFVPPPEWNPGCQLNMNLFGQHPPGTQEFTAKGEGMFF